MVRAANDGVSALIGSRGELLVTAPEYEANVMRARVQPRQMRLFEWLLPLAKGLEAAKLGPGLSLIGVGRKR